MKIKIPSKTFLWGEYSALLGGAAGLLTSPPCFELEIQTKAPVDTPLFHKDSPAGKLIAKYQTESDFSAKELDYNFFDPHDLKGGFGRSTAEYLAAELIAENLFKKQFDEKMKEYLQSSKLQQKIYNSDLLSEVSVQKIWMEYRELFNQKTTVPSGYDLLAQALNASISDNNPNTTSNITTISVENEELNINENLEFLNQVGVIILKTQTKIKTHEHLETLNSLTLSTLKKLSANITESFLNLDLDLFFENLKSFDQKLLDFNLVITPTQRLCKMIQQQDGVLYARGCGALGADVIAVFYDLKQRQSVRWMLESYSELIFVADTQGID